jgi:hypothetical protein
MFIFAVELALLFVHEMDAIRRREWKMFIVLRDMEDEKAYQAFTLLHIPLYVIILMVLFSADALIGFYIVDIFLICHLFLHIGFRKNPANKLDGNISKAIIYISGSLALIHLMGMLFN